MRVQFRDDDLRRLEAEPDFSANYQPGVEKAFRRRMQAIREAPDERPLRGMRSLHFEKLTGDLAGRYSIRLNDQWRLVFELVGEGPDKTVIILAIMDYH